MVMLSFYYCGEFNKHELQVYQTNFNNYSVLLYYWATYGADGNHTWYRE